jgi:alkanesulfonate monooxygenase SsuD/methylene tetrahydromethanopterin reductase-like flavin-dependent oxidoreductase (luciferase family)
MVERVDLARLKEAVLEAEVLGYDSVWVADHLFLGREGYILEGWTFLSSLARITTRLRLGTIHLANLFRAPALTAKMAATLDVISGGRLDFFFEAGHRGSQPEAEAYGFPWEDDRTRWESFEEAVRLIKAMWRDGQASFQGRFYQIKDAYCYPRPLQAPSIPIWIGTIGGEAFSDPLGVNELAVDVIARYADWWNNTPAPLDYCRQVLGLLGDACGKNSRDYKSIGKSLETQVLIAENQGRVRSLQGLIESLNPRRTFYSDWDVARQRYIIGDVNEVRRRIREYTDLGIEYFMVWFMDYPSLDGMRLFGEKIIPYFG